MCFAKCTHFSCRPHPSIPKSPILHVGIAHPYFSLRLTRRQNLKGSRSQPALGDSGPKHYEHGVFVSRVVWCPRSSTGTWITLAWRVPTDGHGSTRAGQLVALRGVLRTATSCGGMVGLPHWASWEEIPTRGGTEEAARDERVWLPKGTRDKPSRSHGTERKVDFREQVALHEPMKAKKKH